MTDQLIVLCTCGSADEAERLAMTVVEARYAACVNILPAVRSIYRWQGAIETAAETLMVIKTTRERFADLRDALKKLHSYETPEILALPIVDGLEEYQVWLTDQVAKGY